MKKIICLISIFLFTGVHALSGVSQIKVEALYDEYRKRYLTPYSTEKQIDVL
jgi:hypothetical protein